MSGNHASRRKAGRAKHLAAYRADGRFSSLSAFIENERLAAALRGEPKPQRKRYDLKTLQFTGAFEQINIALAGAAISVEAWIAAPASAITFRVHERNDTRCNQLV